MLPETAESEVKMQNQMPRTSKRRRLLLAMETAMDKGVLRNAAAAAASDGEQGSRKQSNAPPEQIETSQQQREEHHEKDSRDRAQPNA